MLSARRRAAACRAAACGSRSPCGSAPAGASGRCGQCSTASEPHAGGRQALLHVRRELQVILLAIQAARDARLVGDHHQQVAGRLQPIAGPRPPGKKDELLDPVQKPLSTLMTPSRSTNAALRRDRAVAGLSVVIASAALSHGRECAARAHCSSSPGAAELPAIAHPSFSPAGSPPAARYRSRRP
jgi:hypothetical protein